MTLQVGIQIYITTSAYKCFRDLNTSSLTNLPDLLFTGDVKTGPTALDGLLDFLLFIRRESAPMKISNRTNADKAMMAIVLRFNLWLLLSKFAVIGRSPPLSVGPFPQSFPYGGEEGIPDRHS